MNSRYVFTKPESFKINIAVVSLSFCFDLNNLGIETNDNVISKVKSALNNTLNKEPKFIVFPEYSYCTEFQDIYREFSIKNDVVIIGGSATEANEYGYYSYSPIFLPNGSIKRVYKTRITADEKALSANKIIPYPDSNPREFQYEIDDKIIKFSVFICNDFLQESHPELDNRNDLYFVPQYEKNANLFINQAYRFSTEINAYVIGANISDNGFRSIGTSTLNSTVINALVAKKFRLPKYENNVDIEHYDKSIIYDNEKERIIVISVDLGIPYSLATGNSQVVSSPNVIPIELIEIE